MVLILLYQTIAGHIYRPSRLSRDCVDACSKDWPPCISHYAFLLGVQILVRVGALDDIICKVLCNRRTWYLVMFLPFAFVLLSRKFSKRYHPAVQNLQVVFVIVQPKGNTNLCDDHSHRNCLQNIRLSSL